MQLIKLHKNLHCLHRGTKSVTITLSVDSINVLVANLKTRYRALYGHVGSGL